MGLLKPFIVALADVIANIDLSMCMYKRHIRHTIADEITHLLRDFNVPFDQREFMNRAALSRVLDDEF